MLILGDVLNEYGDNDTLDRSLMHLKKCYVTLLSLDINFDFSYYYAKLQSSTS